MTTTTKKKTTTRKVKLPPNPFIHEILDYVDSQRTKVKKVEALREHRDDSLTAILIWNFDDRVVSAVPEGQVPYKRMRFLSELIIHLFVESGRIYITLLRVVMTH